METKDIRYLNKDFAQFKSSLIEFAKIYFPDTYSDFNESSPGMMFIEMAAMVGDVLSYYTDNQLKQSLLSRADGLANITDLVSWWYKIKNKIPAQVELSVYQLVPAISTTEGKSPDWNYALSINDGMIVSDDITNTEFRTTSIVNFSASSSLDPTTVSVFELNSQTNQPEYYLLEKKVKALAGTTKTKTFTFGSAKPFDKILLDDIDIIDIINITDSDGNIWTEVPNLAQETVFKSILNTQSNDPDLYVYNVPYLLKLEKTSRRYITRFRSDKKVEIQFGAGTTTDLDGQLVPSAEALGSIYYTPNQFDRPIDPSNFLSTRSYGLAPSNTTLTVTYTVGGGIASNVVSDSLRTINSISYLSSPLGLDPVLLKFVKNSVAVNNDSPAVGGKDGETVEEIRTNAISLFGAQSRAVSLNDYVVRCYAMPPQFGAVAKAYVVQDDQINQLTGDRIPNPLAINLYTLGYDQNGNLTQLNKAIKYNLKTYLQEYRILTDAINIRDAFIINIGIDFEIITLPEFNSNEVLLNCIKALTNIFDIKQWQINQPIILSKLYTELDRVQGVQTVTSIVIKNLNDAPRYSGNIYDITTATRNGIIYPSMDPCIFELKYPTSDIQGRVITI